MGQLITRGEVSVGILDLPEVIRLRNAGAPLDFVAPSEGASWTLRSRPSSA